MARLLFLIVILLPLIVHGQDAPVENAALNYRLVGFSLHHAHGTIEIARGFYNNTDSFEHSICIHATLRNGKTIVVVPAFGADYTWRVKIGKNPVLHHFRTLPCPLADTSVSRLRIVTGAGKYPDCYLFVDNTRSLYDMEGRIVWFVPPGIVGDVAATGFRDLKLTPQHNITFIAGEQISEIDYNAKILWHGPNEGNVSHDTTEGYHHEFTRLDNGHYMALGMEHKMVSLPYYHPPDSLPGNITRNADGRYYQSVQFGTLIEYDKAGKLIWAWHSGDYFLRSEMFRHYLPDGSLPAIDVHENAFWFDEQRKVIYVGFKNVSRILKVSYPGGKVIADYGSRNPGGDANHCSADFCGQHSLRLARCGDLLVFNNNSGAYGNHSMAAAFRERNDTVLEKVWGFSCSWDDISPADTLAFLERNKRMAAIFPPDKMISLSMQQSPGGNVMELPGGEYFISLGGAFGKMHIVSRDKKVLWSAVLETRIFPDAPWTTTGTYRASIISKVEIENFLWGNK